MLAVRYLRHIHDWDWLDEVNSRFSGPTCKWLQ